MASRRTRSHGSSTMRSQCWTWSRASAARTAVTGRDRGSGGEQRVRGLIPWPVQPVVQHPAASGELQRMLPLAVMGHDVGEVVAAARLRGRRRRSRPPARWRRPRGDGPVEIPVDASIHAASSSAPARSRTGRRVARGVEGGQDALRASAVAEDDPGPTEPVDDGERAQRVAALRSRPARRRCWRARCERRPDARPGERCARLAWTIRPRRRTTRRARRAPRSVSPASVIASSANARMLSSSRYRGTEPSPSSTMTSERLARRPSTSIAVDAGHVERLRGRTRPPEGARRR